MTDAWPDPVRDLSDEDFQTLGMHGIDIYECRDARESASSELQTQYERGDDQWTLIEWREQRDEPVHVLEDAIYAVKEVDGAPIEMGTTAFVGWFTDD